MGGGVMTLNLDKLAAECSQGMVSAASQGVKDVTKPVETLERLSTKALGVLQAQGIYALVLFLFSRTSDEKAVAPLVRKQLYAALHQIPDFKDNPNLERFTRNEPGPSEVLKFYTDHILGQGALDTTLLVRDLYEQTLIYARYGAKAAGE
jgi:hypothetical protein